MRNAVPIIQGLRLAQKVLGQEMPKSKLALKIIKDYEAALESLAAAIKAQNPAKGSYGDQALKDWSGVMKD